MKNTTSLSGSVDVSPLVLKLAPLLVVVILVIVAASSTLVTVDAGTVGVVKRFGAVQDQALPEGLHFKLPFAEEVVPMDTRLTASEAKASAASRDLQTVTTDVTTTYALDGNMAPLTFQRIGIPSKVATAIVAPAIQESVKAVTAKFTAEELVTQREKVKQQIQQAIANFIDTTMNEKGIRGGLQIANVAITDFRFSEEFNKAIEAKVQAEQQALQAKNEKLRRVTQAEAAASEVKLAAEAQAFTIEAESKARADAITREAEALAGRPEVLRLRSIERWDGVLPKITTSEGIMQMLPLDPKLLEGSKKTP
jgi:regulator of protease activity HflC (stomatin/prohibitin superfamily)